MLDEMGMDIFEDWIRYYNEEPFNHILQRNQLALILSSLSRNSFNECGGFQKQASISTADLKDRLKHIFRAYSNKT